MMRWVLALAAIIASTALHLGFAAWLLPEQIKMEVAGGNQQPAVLMMGKDAFDALVSGEPKSLQKPEEIEEQNFTDTFLEQEVGEAFEVVEERAPETFEKQQDQTKSNLQEVANAQPENVAAQSSDTSTESKLEIQEQRSTPLEQETAKAIPAPELNEAVKAEVQEVHKTRDAQPEPVDETRAQAIVPKTQVVKIPSSAEQPKEVSAKPTAELAEKKATDKTIEGEKILANVPVPQPRPEYSVKKTTKKNAKQTATKKNKAKKTKPKKTGTKQKQQQERKVQNAGSRSESNTNATRGSAATKPSNSKAQGNAKASKYPGRVYAKIARTRRKPSGGSGTARVRFAISASGRLSSISLARSSGDKMVDTAALDHVRRAAPFPKPPSGAKRSFVIPLQFKN